MRKRERLGSLLWAVVLSLGAVLGGLGMMITGLRLPVDILPLGILCFLAALALCGLLSYPYGGWYAAAAGAAVWLFPGLRLQLKALGRRIVHYMTLAYELPCPTWLEADEPDTLLPVLLVLGCLMMIPWIRCLLKRKTAVPAVAVSLLPLLSCVTVTDTVPQLPWVFIWMLTLTLLMMTQSSRRENTTKGNRLAAMLLVPMCLALGLLFWLLPEEKVNNWDLSDALDRIARQLPFVQETEHGVTLDFSPSKPEDQVNLGTMAQRKLTDRKIMDVTAEHSGMLYLRERDYDHYSGVAWSSTTGRTETVKSLSSLWSVGEGTVHIQTHFSRDYYYLPCYPGADLTFTDGMLTNSVRSRSYSFEVRRLRPDWYELLGGTGAGSAMGHYLQLPEQTRTDTQRYFLQNGFPDRKTVPEQAEFIRSLVQQCASYDLNAQKMPSDQEDLALWFLEAETPGYCVHFATTAAVLLRGAGIPARYVEGYVVHVEPGQTVTVEQRHGHAWVEYYVEGVGWLILEATPSDGMPDSSSASQQTQPTTSEPTQSTETQPTETQPTETQPQPTQKPKATQEQLPWLPTVILAGLVVAVIGSVLQYVLRRRKKKRQMYTGEENAQALARYQELCRLSAFLKVPIPTEMTQLAQKAKFSSHTLTEGELTAMSHQIETFRQHIQTLSPLKRVAAKLIWVLR